MYVNRQDNKLYCSKLQQQLLTNTNTTNRTIVLKEDPKIHKEKRDNARKY